MTEQQQAELLKYAAIESRQYKTLNNILDKLKNISCMEEYEALKGYVDQELEYSRFVIAELQDLLDEVKGG